jgi:hypothetical protein
MIQFNKYKSIELADTEIGALHVLDTKNILIGLSIGKKMEPAKKIVM